MDLNNVMCVCVCVYTSHWIKGLDVGKSACSLGKEGLAQKVEASTVDQVH